MQLLPTSQLNSILDKLGYDRVIDGARSFQPLDDTIGSWNGCFLSRVYGERGELVKKSGIEKGVLDQQAHENMLKELSKFGLDDNDIEIIVGAYDQNFSAFQALVLNWIKEHSPKKGVTTKCLALTS